MRRVYETRFAAIVPVIFDVVTGFHSKAKRADSPNKRLLSALAHSAMPGPSPPPPRVVFFLSSHVAGNFLHAQHGGYRPSTSPPITHPGLACIDLRLVSRNGPRMLCCANKLLTNPPHATTDTTRDCWKGTCSSRPKPVSQSIRLGGFCAHHIQHPGPLSPAP